MARIPKPKLPPEPTGHKLLDVVWAHYSYLAPSVLALMPREVDPIWATAAGLRRYLAVSEARDEAKAELERTPKASSVRRLREQELRQLEKQSLECAASTLAALVAAAQAAHRRARPGQIWMLVLEGLKALFNDLPLELETESQP